MTGPPVPLVLQVRGLVKVFGDRPVPRGVDVDVHEHQVVALIGASGSGKSTLLRCINLLERVDDGQVLLDGADVTHPRVEVDDVRRRIGVVFQAYNLFPHMTVLDNVTLAPRVVRKVSRREAEARALALLDRIGLADKARDYPDRLSGGQQQRAAIARAVANDPRLLLLDEVTSALDPELVNEVLDTIRLLRDEGMTMIVVSHEMAFVREVASTVVFMDQGRVVEVGPPAQVFDAPQTDRLRSFTAKILRH